jgi:hypothetical protein
MGKHVCGSADHEVGTYRTDCKCKDRFYRRFRDGMEHLQSCADATALYFHGHYQEPRVVATREGGLVV